MNKLFLFSGAVILLGSIYLFESHKGVDPFPSQREFKVSYETYIGAIPQDAKKLSVWIPLASSREGQIVKKREIITGLPYRITKDPVYGNEMAYFEVSDRVPQGLNFQVTYYAQTLQKNFASSNHETGVNRYLKPNHLMVVNDEVRKRTQQAIHGKRNLLEQARGIYENVINWMKYDKTIPGWGRGDTARACLLGKGNCTDFHSLFISMAHAAEIPARFKIGLTVPDGAEGEIPGYHCWAEFYEEGKGWQPVDASEAWKHPERKEVYFGNYDTNKFLISVGRDINLVPKQSGPPVNIFFYPYVEVDGKEWNGVKTSFQFKNLKTTGGEK